MPDETSISYLSEKESISTHDDVCMTHTNKPDHCHNAKKSYFDPNATFPILLSNTTYWWNEYMHVGHFHYELVLFQLLANMKIDRVVIQRAACYGTSCVGIGSIESYYKGFFGIAFEAFGQPDIPVYLRYTWNQREVSPIYFSVYSPSFYNENNASVSSQHYPNIPLQPSHCFRRFIRRAQKKTDFGRTVTVSKRTIEQFRKTAYRVINEHVERHGLPTAFTYFTASIPLDPPLPALNYTRLVYRYGSKGAEVSSSKNKAAPGHNDVLGPLRILIAYRGATSTRHITNLNVLVNHLRANFSPPQFEIALLDTSNPQLGFMEQAHAVASSTVVICNHGAFEGNMIYMQRGSLLLELFGMYGNNEVHTFHRLAMNLGLFYARLNPVNMTEHHQKTYILTPVDLQQIQHVIDDYSQRKAYLHPIV